MDREEAIRRIKAWNLDPDDREALFAVIPELKESQLTREDIDTMALEHVKKLNPTLSELLTKESLRASYYLRGEYDTYRQGLIDMYNKIKSDRFMITEETRKDIPNYEGCEDYVSFKTAKLLKKKGFNAKCNKCYAYFADDDIRCLNLKYPKSAQLLIANRYPCITLQMAMKWLREEKCIAVVPILSSVLDNERFLWDIEITIAKTNESYHQGWIYESYEQAAEAAIKYCLENLI